LATCDNLNNILENKNALETSIPGVFYQIFVRSFCDSNGDGIGDISGITSKLSYLKDLGIEGIWLSPIFQSPSYHKYDVVDYYQIDSDYGNLQDFDNLVKKANSLGIKIILDWVINHTSSDNPWFLEAKKGKDSPFRDFYSWKTPLEIKEKGLEMREITADSGEKQPWHWANKGDTEKYYGLFWSKMPDLNMESRKLREEIYKIGKYWLEKGVAGFRMDAAKHIYPDYEVEKCHAFWQEFRNEMEAINPSVYVVGEVWTSAKNIAPFFKGIKAIFDFDLCFGIRKIIETETDSENLIATLMANYKLFSTFNEGFVEATMLSNHDMDRIASAAHGNLDKLKMAVNLLFLLPGNPYVYYGDELGMLGKKPDENIREAFLWDSRWQDASRTNWRKPKYNTDSKVKPLKMQETDLDSLYLHYKKMIALRKNHPALCQITVQNLATTATLEKGVLSFKRPHIAGEVIVFQNITSVVKHFKIKDDFFETLYASSGSGMLKTDEAVLKPYGCLVLKK
jgi:alpha-amylase